MDDYTYEGYKKVNPSDPTAIPRFVDPLPIPPVVRLYSDYDYSCERKAYYNVEMVHLKQIS
ncbi:hypothetical protein [Clostridium sp.]|uniref:hypothetical protein n=1 Tax=Clostridium sp. TaxID=1506 RepID=UPI002FC8313F